MTSGTIYQSEKQPGKREIRFTANVFMFEPTAAKSEAD